MKKKTSAGRLHCFGSGQLLKSLKAGYLPLQPGLPLTTPFVDFDRWHADNRRPVGAEALEAEWQRHYAAMPDAVRSLLSFEHFRAQGGAIAADVLASAQRRQHGGSPRYDRGWLGQARILRLFPSALCYEGWRGLAEDFAGMAVVLDSGHAALQPSRERPCLLAPVVYGGPHRFKVTSDNPFPGLLEDHGSRRDSQEWRLLMPQKTAARHDGQAVLPLGRGLVRGMIWSIATPDALIEELRYLVKHDMRYRSVQLGRVIPDSQRWQLMLETQA